MANRRDKVYTVRGKPGTEEQFLAALKRWIKKNDTVEGFTTKHGYLHKDGKVYSSKLNKKTGKVKLRDTKYRPGQEVVLTPEEIDKKKLEAARKKKSVEIGKKQTSTKLDATDGYKTGKRKEVLQWITNKFGRRLEDHHVRFKNLLEPFYEGLNDSEAKKLTDWLVEGGFPTGNVVANLQAIDTDLHQYVEDSIHKWARENNIQVIPFTKEEWAEGKRNINKKTGRVLGDVDGMLVDSDKTRHVYHLADLPPDMKVHKASKARMVYLGGLDGGKFGPARQNALREYLNLIEEPLMDKTTEVLAKQDLRRAKVDPNYKPQTKKQWLTTLTQQASEAADELEGAQDILSNKQLIKAAAEQGIDITEESLTSTNSIRKMIGVGGKSTKGKLVKRLIGSSVIGVGFVLSEMNRQAAAAEYENNPTTLNMIQHKIAQVDQAIEGFDLATGGFGSVTTFPAQMLMLGSDLAIDYYENHAHEKKHSTFLGPIPGTKDYPLKQAPQVSNIRSFIGETDTQLQDETMAGNKTRATKNINAFGDGDFSGSDPQIAKVNKLNEKTPGVLTDKGMDKTLRRLGIDPSKLKDIS